MKLGTTIILLFICLSIQGQELDFEKDFDTISKAINSGDSKTISDFAPRGEFAPVDYVAPRSKSERILKDEFEKRLTKLFAAYPPKEFVLLDVRRTEMSLPMAVGRYLTKDDKKYYVIMMFAIFEKSYGFLTFHVVDKLPSSMKSLDR